MKYTWKWVSVFFAVLVVLGGLEATKFAWLNHMIMDISHHSEFPDSPWAGSPVMPDKDSSAFPFPQPLSPTPGEFPRFSPGPLPLELMFVLFSISNMAIYFILFVPLLYGAYQLGRHAFKAPMYKPRAAFFKHINALFKQNRGTGADAFAQQQPVLVTKVEPAPRVGRFNEYWSDSDAYLLDQLL